ncbi:MAG TPA: hypothetical protein DCM86_13175 [Verrucomicrobiales bacterium]|nr:hypothetical protein [Verrucomicrobiales bacterium]
MSLPDEPTPGPPPLPNNVPPAPRETRAPKPPLPTGLRILKYLGLTLLALLGVLLLGLGILFASCMLGSWKPRF